jgi:hypothetical protein
MHYLSKIFYALTFCWATLFIFFVIFATMNELEITAVILFLLVVLGLINICLGLSLKEEEEELEDFAYLII